jgi:hypothetical protein
MTEATSERIDWRALPGGADRRREPGREIPPPDESGRWRRRPQASRVVRAGLALGPLALAVAVAVVVAVLVPELEGGARAGWWLLVVGSGVLVFVALHAVARRFLPLASLLQLALVFPGRAPSRTKIALRGTSRARLETWAREPIGARAGGDPAELAAEILGLAGALHARDRLMRGHADRVHAYAELIGEELRLSEEDTELLQWVALLHDIGKLRIPTAILNKRGRLDHTEWEVMRWHPADGVRIAEPLQAFLGEWAGTIADHHEHYDGTGYPNGLAGEEISLGGRIVTVADAYEAMTAPHSYRQPMSAATARVELAKKAGSQFDPRVVRALMNVSPVRLRRVAGAGAWLTTLPVLRPLAPAGARIGSAFTRPALATRAAAAAGVIVVGVALTQIGMPGGVGDGESSTAAGGSGSAGDSSASRGPTPAVDRRPVVGGEAAGADTAGADTAGGGAADAGPAGADRPAGRSGGAPGGGSTPTAPGSPGGGAPGDVAPPADGPPTAGPPDGGGQPPAGGEPPPPASPGLPPIGGQLGPIEVGVLPTPGVGLDGEGPGYVQIGDIVIP